MTESVDTLIVGAGQAGLALSYYLTQAGQEHILLERAAQLADAWRNHRWDSFTLVTPNWHIRLPGGEYRGSAPDGFLPRDEIVRYLENYAASFSAPVRLGINVTAVDRAEMGYRVSSDQGEFLARNVVIAVGIFQQPRIPAYAANLPASLLQMHSGEYRNPAALPPGAVLVVGSAQSGAQIAEELYQSGRKVYLSLGGSAGRAPRRYRGRDITEWLFQAGFFDLTYEQIPAPKTRLSGNPQISGKAGGHTLNLHQFARDGVTLLGHITGAQGGRLSFAEDHKDSLAKIDAFEGRILKMVDTYIEKQGIDAPEESLPQLRDGFDTKIITELDLEAHNITSLIWAIGYVYDFQWIHLPVLDAEGFPVHQQGVTAFPGLYFIGLPWQTRRKSNLLLGIGDDAAVIAEHINR